MRSLGQRVILGLAVLLLVWLYKQSTQVNVDLHVRTIQHFEQLREYDAKLNQYVLQARYGLLHNYDPLVSTQLDMNRILDALAAEKPDAFGAGDNAIQSAFANYRIALNARSELIESFKSHNAVLRNSLRYIPLAIKFETSGARDFPDLDLFLHELLDSVLLFDQNATAGNKAHIENLIQRLKQSKLIEKPEVMSLIRHVEVILGHRTEVDDLVKQVAQSPSSALADNLLELYSQDFARRDHSASLYKLAMALLSATMLAYVVWLLTHLQRARDTLAASLRELEFQKNALDMHSIVSVADRSGKIIYTNGKFSEVSQYSAEELLGQDHRLLNSGHHPPGFFQSMWSTISSGKTWQAEILNRRKDGTLYWVDSTIAPFMDEAGKPLRYVSIRTDITARKESEATLRKAKEDADAARQVAEIAQHDAEQANRIKGDFLANMSHEIRTPMNGIIGMTNLALNTELSADQREYLNLIKSSSDSLLHVINDILDFSKIESGKFELENIVFSLEGILRDTMKTFSLRAQQKGLELIVSLCPDIPEEIVGDPGRLRQVIVNLIGNAIKFTESGEIELQVKNVSKDESGVSRLSFSVRDTGIGIPSEKFETIFESFSQADTSTTRRFGGTGLGLTISNQIVRMMGGNIQVQSEIGKGSTFEFTLTFAHHEKNSRMRIQGTEKLAGMRVLLIDDNASSQRVLVEMTSRWKMLPLSASNIDEALIALRHAALEGPAFDLVLVDDQIVVSDNADLPSVVHNCGHPSIPILMMLASQYERDDAESGKSRGIHGYVVKPIFESELKNAILVAIGESPTTELIPIASTALQSAERKLSLLVAEDNSVNQILAIHLLEKQGHTVTLAHNGREALDLWRANKFDAILMDVDMPEMNGYEATGRIREAEKNLGIHIPIIAMTAHAMKGSREECLSHGMDGYVSKPIHVDLLRKELDSVLSIDLGSTMLLPVQMNKQDRSVANFEQLRKVLDNDQALFNEITGQYLQDAPALLTKIKEGMEPLNPAHIRSAAHTLQGMASVLAADRTVSAAQQVEIHSEETGLATAVSELEDAMRELENAINEYRWEPKP